MGSTEPPIITLSDTKVIGYPPELKSGLLFVMVAVVGVAGNVIGLVLPVPELLVEGG
jgi:hypothetical protein